MSKSRATARLYDWCTGHGARPPRQNDEASTNVFINGLGAHRVGDHWPSGHHGHDGSLGGGSTTVFVNGKPLGRIGDPVDCGSLVATGSPNVFTGGAAGVTIEATDDGYD